ncbi:MAG: MarC family protein [Ignisphaera sp.]|nr:MarC family protein [Ignisphaera sp.]MCX8168550.1 MarC family protein [Ignisphaera sp.]MDW8085136.1 MarC family protein [Ignisphaera sp.]
MVDPWTVIWLSIQLFAIMDPLAAVPALLDVISPLDSREAIRLINRASIAIFILLTIFSTVGGYILLIFGISISSLKMAAGIILMATAIDTLITGHKPEKIRVGEYLIVPIATPLIVGPGTLTLLVTSSRLYGILNTLTASYMAFIYTYIILRFSNRITRLAGETFIHGLGRFMSIIIASFAVEMFIGGIREFIAKL